MALTIKDLVPIKVILVVHQTIIWGLSQKEDMSRIVVAQIMAQRGAPFEVAKNGVMGERTEACQIDGDLIQISTMTLIDQMNFVKNSTQTSGMATAYVNLRDGGVHPKKRNGDEVVQVHLFLLITGNSMKEKAGVQTVDLLDIGMDGGLQMSDFPVSLRIHGTGEDEMKVSGGAHPQDMRTGDPEEGIISLGLMILRLKIILTHPRTMQEEESMVVGDEDGVLQEEDEKVCFPLQMNSLTLKEAEWMEIENQVPARITPLMMVTLQQIENALPHSREWTWPRCHLENVLGMMDLEPLIVEIWTFKVGLQRREEKDVENQVLLRGCQNLQDPAL